MCIKKREKNPAQTPADEKVKKEEDAGVPVPEGSEEDEGMDTSGHS